MRVLISVCIFVISAALSILYQIGSPFNGYEYAQQILPVLVGVMAVTPLVILSTKWVDSADKQVIRSAWCLALLFPYCLWEIGNTMIMQIAKVGGCNGC